MLIDVDTAGDGFVEFAEFLTLFVQRMGMVDYNAEADLLAGIARLDVAGNGRVSIRVAEMSGFLSHDRGYDEQEVGEIFAYAAAAAAICDGGVDCKMLEHPNDTVTSLILTPRALGDSAAWPQWPGV
jgi:hypothetical protein